MSFKAKERAVEIRFENQNDPLPNESGSAISIRADLGQLEQVLINIIKNAIEAADKTDGQIQIILSPNPKQLRIRDNGRGISKSIEDKLFTPFFTTKMVDKVSV